MTRYIFEDNQDPDDKEIVISTSLKKAVIKFAKNVVPDINDFPSYQALKEWVGDNFNVYEMTRNKIKRVL